MNSAPKLRVARPTDNLDAPIRFYRDGLGLQILYRFENHDGYDAKRTLPTCSFVQSLLGP